MCRMVKVDKRQQYLPAGPGPDRGRGRQECRHYITLIKIYGRALHRLHQACDGLLGEGEDVGRKDPHVESPDDCQDQSEYRSR